MINDILKTAQEIYKTVAAVYPEDPEQAKRTQEKQQQIEFSEWWAKRWKKTSADVNNRFREGSEASIKNRQLFKERYEELVKDKMATLPARQIEARQQLFDSISNPVFDSIKANYTWREQLHSDVRKMLKSLANNLALELQQEVLALVKELDRQLWNSPLVKTKLIDDDLLYVKLLEHSLNTLFLRFARPVAELLIRGAVGSETRSETRKKIGPDIEIIDNYYSGGEPALERLCQYANHGVDLITNPKKRQEVLGSSAKIAKVIIGTNPFANIAVGVAETIVNELGKSIPAADPKNTVIVEVEADLKALEHYLIYGIFEASGFGVFCQQEIDNLRDNFLDVDTEGSWAGIVGVEWREGNAELLKELPVNLQAFNFDTEVSDTLKQLRIALDATH